MLEVGREYVLRAIPGRGYAFTNWTLVSVITITEFLFDQSHGSFTRSTRIESPSSEQVTDPLLRFTMQPEEVIFESSVRRITTSIGWQANFVPARKSFPK
jgi:hypothetical protein